MSFCCFPSGTSCQLKISIEIHITEMKQPQNRIYTVYLYHHHRTLIRPSANSDSGFSSPQIFYPLLNGSWAKSSKSQLTPCFQTVNLKLLFPHIKIQMIQVTEMLQDASIYTQHSEIRLFTALLFNRFMRNAFSWNPLAMGMVVQKHLDCSLIGKQLSKHIGKNSPTGNTALTEGWPNTTMLPFYFFLFLQSSSSRLQERYSLDLSFYTVYTERGVKVQLKLQSQKTDKNHILLCSIEFYRIHTTGMMTLKLAHIAQHPLHSLIIFPHLN